MKHLLKKHRMLSVGIFLAAVLSIIYAAIQIGRASCRERV